MGHSIYTNSKHVDIANHYRLGLTSKLQHYQTTIVRKQLDSTTEKRYDCTFSLVWWESSALNVIVLFSIGGTNTQVLPTFREKRFGAPTLAQKVPS